VGVKIYDSYRKLLDLVSKKADEIANRFLDFLSRKLWESFLGVWLLSLPKIVRSIFKLIFWGLVAGGVYYLFRNVKGDLKEYPLATIVFSLFSFVDFSKVSKYAFFAAFGVFFLPMMLFTLDLLEWIWELLDLLVEIKIEIN